MKSPSDVVAAWERAWNAGDADALAALFADDAEFVNVVGLWWHDRASIREAHAYGFSTIFTGSVITMSSQRVRWVGTDAATVHCRWRIVGQVAPPGEVAEGREGIFTFVLERRGDVWITVAAQNTDIAPGMETHINTASGQRAIDYRAL